MTHQSPEQTARISLSLIRFSFFLQNHHPVSLDHTRTGYKCRRTENKSWYMEQKTYNTSVCTWVLKNLRLDIQTHIISYFHELRTANGCKKRMKKCQTNQLPTFFSAMYLCNHLSIELSSYKDKNSRQTINYTQPVAPLMYSFFGTE